MECRNCPYIKDEFDKRMNWYQKKVDEQGIPNDIYGDMTYDEAANYEEEYCWCEKTGGKVWWYGQCSDICSSNDKPVHKSKKKRRNKRERDFKYKKHLEYISKNAKGYPHPAYPVDKYGEYVPDNQWYIWFPDDVPQEIAYYKRCYRSSNGKRGRSRQYKKVSNRKIRRYKGEIPNGFWCHRLYDFWWQIY